MWKMEFDLCRFGQWTEQGVWEALLETLVKMRLADGSQHMH